MSNKREREGEGKGVKEKEKKSFIDTSWMMYGGHRTFKTNNLPTLLYTLEPVLL